MFGIATTVGILEKYRRQATAVPAAHMSARSSPATSPAYKLRCASNSSKGRRTAQCLDWVPLSTTSPRTPSTCCLQAYSVRSLVQISTTAPKTTAQVQAPRVVSDYSFSRAHLQPNMSRLIDIMPVICQGTRDMPAANRLHDRCCLFLAMLQTSRYYRLHSDQVTLGRLMSAGEQTCRRKERVILLPTAISKFAALHTLQGPCTGGCRAARIVKGGEVSVIIPPLGLSGRAAKTALARCKSPSQLRSSPLQAR